MPIRRTEMGNPWLVVSHAFQLPSLHHLSIHFFASSLLKSLYVMIPIALQVEIAITQTTLYSRVRGHVSLSKT